MDFYDEIGSLALGSRLRRLSDGLTEEARQVYALYDVGLDPKWFPVYQVLSQHPEGLATTAIARRIGHSHASVSQIVKEMVRARLATSRRSAADARANVIRLSARGRALAPRLDRQYRDAREAVDELLGECATDLWRALGELESALARRGFFERVKARRRRREAAGVEVVDYTAELQPAFRALNLEWIEQHFGVEPADLALLDAPEERILGPGGAILFVRQRDELVGTCALIPMGDGRFELAKMAIAPAARGRGLGLVLGRAAIARARELGARALYLESNTVLEPAIALYRKLGFRAVRDGPSPYARCNIQMQLEISPQPEAPPDAGR